MYKANISTHERKSNKETTPGMIGVVLWHLDRDVLPLFGVKFAVIVY